jgi:hypothetical protein
MTPLYHFTSRDRLPGIAKYGLTVGDVPTDIAKHSGRVGVWLTTAKTSGGHGLEVPAGLKVPTELEGLGKTRFRLEVEIPYGSPSLHQWTEWAQENCTVTTIEALHTTATSFDTWYVYFGVIRPEAIVACVDMQSDEAMLDWTLLPQRPGDPPGVPAWRRDAWQAKMLKQVRAAIVANEGAGRARGRPR